MQETNILVVEDETRVADVIKRGLEEQNYFVDIAYDGYVGKTMSESKKYDLIILDINLPKMNGFDLCKAIRQTTPNVPIIFLTALGAKENKLTGFDLGADDYIVKPFEFKELLARVRVFLRRTDPNQRHDKVLRVADLEIDTDKKSVKRGGTAIDLTAKEYNLLEFLVRNKGTVISKVEIAEKIWDIGFDTGTNIIEVYVNYLRKKLDKDFPDKLIQTKVGQGYYITDKLD